MQLWIQDYMIHIMLQLIFISLDRCSIPSREGSILWSYLDITLLFSSYVYLIFINVSLLRVSLQLCLLFSYRITFLSSCRWSSSSKSSLLELQFIFIFHFKLYFVLLILVFSFIKSYFLEIMLCPLFLFLFRDLSFGIRKLHQIHFVFLLIVLGYQSLFYTSSLSSSLDLISIAGKEFTSHRIQILSFFISSLCLSLVFIFGSEIY